MPQSSPGWLAGLRRLAFLFFLPERVIDGAAQYQIALHQTAFPSINCGICA
jgi:hypothetical protein